MVNSYFEVIKTLSTTIQRVGLQEMLLLFVVRNEKKSNSITAAFELVARKTQEDCAPSRA